MNPVLLVQFIHPTDRLPIEPKIKFYQTGKLSAGENSMDLTRRNPVTIRFALLLAVIAGTFGSGLSAQALSSQQSDTCEPKAGWIWTIGSSQPEAAQQAEATLRKLGIESAVLATDYGEKDSCGNFEPFSTDFTVTLKNDSRLGQPSNQRSEVANTIRAALLQFGKPQLGNVRIDFGDGAAKSYPSSLGAENPTENAALAPDSSLNVSASLNKKVLLLVFDPILSNGQDLNTYMGWPAYSTLVQGIVNSFQSASHGQLQYTIAQTQIVSNEWPVKIDGFRYTQATYLDVMQS